MASREEAKASPKDSLEQQDLDRHMEDVKQPVDAAMTLDGSGIGHAASQQTRKERITARLRRNSSKLLSLLRGRRDLFYG